MARKFFRILLIALICISANTALYGRAGGGGGSSSKSTRSHSTTKSNTSRSYSSTNKNTKGKNNGNPLVVFIVVGAIAAGIGIFALVKKYKKK